jgi:large subunit ribosomal protein L15
LISNVKSTVKILGKGDLTKKLQVTVHKFSKSAEEKITAIGGTANLIKKSG